MDELENMLAEMLETKNKICGNEKCKKEFTPGRPDQLYCSELCKKHTRGRRRIRSKICEYCNKKYETKRGNQRFCSHECSVKYSQDVMGMQKSLPKTNRDIRTTIVSLVNSAKHRCAIKGIEFNISKEWIDSVCIQETCPITNLKFTNDIVNGVRAPTNRSIDRINLNKGYTDDNIRLVCIWANVARNEWGDEVLIKMCRAVVNGNGGG